MSWLGVSERPYPGLEPKPRDPELGGSWLRICIGAFLRESLFVK